MNIVSILRQARSWALYHIGSYDIYSNVIIHLDIKDIKDVEIRDFLLEVPMWFGMYKLKNWWSELYNSENMIKFDQGQDTRISSINIYICIIEDKYGAYASLYDDTGKRLIDQCLIFWDKYKCDVTNIGYAPGRCPDIILPYTGILMYTTEFESIKDKREDINLLYPV